MSTEITADIAQIKTAIKNIQKVIDTLSSNLDMDRHDIAQIKVEMATLNSQVYTVSEQIAKQSSKIADRVVDKTEEVAQEVLESVAKKGKNHVIKKWYQFWR